jgi:hypothetical protein
MFARQLSRELIALVLIKVAALTLLFFLFIAPMRRPPLDADTAARMLISGDEAAPATTERPHP